jgi:hypothetical protein
MVEMLLSAVPFGDVKHTGDTILRASKQLLAGYGVGQYECSFTASGTEIVLVDTVFPCVHMKVTDNASNIKRAFKFFDDEATNRKRK